VKKEQIKYWKVDSNVEGNGLVNAGISMPVLWTWRNREGASEEMAEMLFEDHDFLLHRWGNIAENFDRPRKSTSPNIKHFFELRLLLLVTVYFSCPSFEHVEVVFIWTSFTTSTQDCCWVGYWKSKKVNLI
jgi:hypothetical protein